MRMPPARRITSPAASQMPGLGQEDAVARKAESRINAGGALARLLHCLDRLLQRSDEVARGSTALPPGVRRGHGTVVRPEHGEAAGRRRERRGRDRRAMIGEGGDDGALAAGRVLGDAQSEVVRLAAGAGEHRMAEMGRRARQQALGIGDDRLTR